MARIRSRPTEVKGDGRQEPFKEPHGASPAGALAWIPDRCRPPVLESNLTGLWLWKDWVRDLTATAWASVRALTRDWGRHR